jgi:Plavaka transposase
MEAPLYAFEEIMKWARKAVVEGYNFLRIQKTYCTQIDKLEKWMCMENHHPEEISVNLPGFKNTIDTIKVTRFDFMTQVKSLLDDPVLNRDENLVINEIDRFQKYYPPNGRLGECLSGSWYNHAWDEMEKDRICDFMIPIILYIDKTQISASGKLSINPVQMSLGIFTEKASHYLSYPLFT